MSRLAEFPVAAGLLLLALRAPASAALAGAAHEDIHFVAEHVPEAFQDARFFALPWPSGGEPLKAWRPVLDVGWTSARADFFGARGFLSLVGGTYRRSERGALQVFGFFDGAQVSGSEGGQILRASFLGSSPLDLPERARFSRPRGSFRHFGVGANWTRTLSERWALQAGALASRLDVRGFRLDFELLGGRDAGLRGVLDHSGAATYVTPFLGVQRGWRWSPRGSLRARAAAGAPLPPGEFAGRITTASFSASSADPHGRPGKIGNAFVSFGLAFLHEASGLEIDLGSTAFFTVFEEITHSGISNALLVEVRWHPK